MTNDSSAKHNQPTAAAMKAANRIASYLELCHNISIPDVQIHRIASDIDRECKIAEIIAAATHLDNAVSGQDSIDAHEELMTLIEELQESEASHD